MNNGQRDQKTSAIEAEWKFPVIIPSETEAVSRELFGQLAAIVVVLRDKIETLEIDIQSLRGQNNFLCFVLEGIYRGLGDLSLPDRRGWWKRLWRQRLPLDSLQHRMLELMKELPDRIRGGEVFQITEWAKNDEDTEAPEASQ